MMNKVNRGYYSKVKDYNGFSDKNWTKFWEIAFRSHDHKMCEYALYRRGRIFCNWFASEYGKTDEWKECFIDMVNHYNEYKKEAKR